MTMSANVLAAAPLAEKLRPQSFDDFVGQEHLVGKDSLLRTLCEDGHSGSMILWGPAGYDVVPCFAEAIFS